MTGIIAHGQHIYIGDINSKEVDMSYRLRMFLSDDNSLTIEDMRDGAYEQTPSVVIPVDAMLPLSQYLISQFHRYTVNQNQMIKNATKNL